MLVCVCVWFNVVSNRWPHQSPTCCERLDYVRSPSCSACPSVFLGVLVLISIAWIPVIHELQGSQMFIYIQVVGAYIVPPIAATYLLAILWRRTNEKVGACARLCFGALFLSLSLFLSVALITTLAWLSGQFTHTVFVYCGVGRCRR